MPSGDLDLDLDRDLDLTATLGRPSCRSVGVMPPELLVILPRGRGMGAGGRSSGTSGVSVEASVGMGKVIAGDGPPESRPALAAAIGEGSIGDGTSPAGLIPAGIPP